MQVILRLLQSARKYWKYLMISMVALLVLTATQLYTPWIIRDLITLVTNQDPLLGEKALHLALVLCITYGIQGISQYIRAYYTHFAAWNFVSDIRVQMYEHLQQLSLEYYHDKQTGQLMSRVSNDTATLELLIAHAAPDLIINLLILIGVAFILFSINVTLALLSIISVPFLILMGIYFATKVRPTFRQAHQTLAEFNATLHDNLAGIKEIQVFNQQDREKKRIFKSSQTYTIAMLKALRLSAFYHPAMQFLNNMGTVLVIGYGGYLASIGKVPLEDLIAFILYLNIFYQPISNLARLNEDLQNAYAGAQRIFEILDTPSVVQEAENPISLKTVKGDIVFENVSFAYEPGNDVLKNINLHIKPGEMVALVGPTGVGKTTLISLLHRFYDPTEGNIRVDGQDLRFVSLDNLRSQMSIVLQDTFLFNGTVAENIAYGKPNATKEEIIAAAKAAHAHEFIEKLDYGYDSIIGERGIKLSGGQKQRLSIARAILRNAPILILDEATASVDVQTEKLIYEAMDNVVANRTTLMIAHRLSTIKKADKIVVLHEGKIKEMGTHQELYEKKGFYYQLCQIQFQYQSKSIY